MPPVTSVEKSKAVVLLVEMLLIQCLLFPPLFCWGRDMFSPYFVVHYSVPN